MRNAAKRNDAFEAHPVCGLRNRLHQSLQVAHFRRWQRDQHADRSHDVTERYGQSADQERAWDCSACILDFVTHERCRFASGKGIDQHRPENHIVDVCAGDHGVKRKRSRRSVKVPRHRSHPDDDADGNPHCERAHVVQPCADVESEHVEYGRDCERDQREQDVVRGVIRQMAP